MQVSKARCRFEAERACQRILGTYQTGDVVDAVLPHPISSTPSATATSATAGSYYEALSEQAVPSTPVVEDTHPSTATAYGRTIKLQKLGNLFVSASDVPPLPLTCRGLKEPDLHSLSGMERFVLKRGLQEEEEEDDRRQRQGVQSMQEVDDDDSCADEYFNKMFTSPEFLLAGSML